jgi:hypothetical protein
MVHLHLPGGTEETVQAIDLFLDGGVFESGVEDVHRLVLARHVENSSLWSEAAPRTGGGGRDGRVVTAV